VRDVNPSEVPGGRSDSVLRERATSAAGVALRHRPSYPGAGGCTKAVIPTTRDVPTASTPDHGPRSPERRPNAAGAAEQARRLYRSGQSDSLGSPIVHRQPRPRPDLGLSRCKALSGSGERALRQTSVRHSARSPAARHLFGGQRAARRASWVHPRVGSGAPCGSCGMGGLEAHGAVRALRCRAMRRGG
jgi:hypothetical protein